jgi:hypothetical protein
MGQVETEAVDTAKTIGYTASLADGVSAKVKQLDLAKSRVSDCQQRVNDLIDLRLCAEGVKSALADEDYEKAAAHLHRFLAMDEALLKVKRFLKLFFFHNLTVKKKVKIMRYLFWGK